MWERVRGGRRGDKHSTPVAVESGPALPEIKQGVVQVTWRADWLELALGGEKGLTWWCARQRRLGLRP
jgi:hypothetical protein